MLSAGVFKISQIGANENGNVGGDCDITGTVTNPGAAGLTIIDGQKIDRVFDVLGAAPSSIKVVFAGLTIRNGKVSGDGGGIRVSNADLVVRKTALRIREPGIRERQRRRHLQRHPTRDRETSRSHAPRSSAMSRPPTARRPSRPGQQCAHNERQHGAAMLGE